MPELNTLEMLLAHQIKDLYSAETQLLKALPNMAKAAATEELQDAFNTHLEETKGHVSRLEEVAELLGTSPHGKICNAMTGLVEEASETIDQGGDPVILDLALIGAAQKAEHYEIAGYGTVRALADSLGLDEVAELLQTTLDEEAATDDNLTMLAEQLVPMVMEDVAAELGAV